MKLSLLLIPLLLFMTSCTIDRNDEKDKKITELEKQVTELKISNEQLNKEKQELLIWKYFTPDFAERKIEFFMNWNFSLNEDSGSLKNWKYTLNWDTLTLLFDEWDSQKLSFYKWNDSDNNFYIKWDWEYFVKE